MILSYTSRGKEALEVQTVDALQVCTTSLVRISRYYNPQLTTHAMKLKVCMRNHYHHSTIYLFLVEHYSCYTGGLVLTACACMIILRKPENPFTFGNAQYISVSSKDEAFAS